MTATQTKRCGGCKQERPLDCFAKNAKRGYQSYCRDCNKAAKNAWNAANRQKVKWHAMWNKYRLRREDWERLFEDQDGLCAVCRDNPATHVDHDHNCCPGETSCGECVRGILCAGCNTAVGFIETNPERTQSVLRYIQNTCGYSV